MIGSAAFGHFTLKMGGVGLYPFSWIGKAMLQKSSVSLSLRSHCPELGHPIDLAAGAVAMLRNMIIIIDLDTLIHSCLGAEQEITLNRVRESK